MRPKTGPFRVLDPGRHRQHPPNAGDKLVRSMPYRLEILRDEKWRLLAGYFELDRALEAGPLRRGEVRVVKGRRGKEVVLAGWRDGVATEEVRSA